jgi:hypothetical protein
MVFDFILNSRLWGRLSNSTSEFVNVESDFVGQLISFGLSGSLGVYANHVLSSGRPEIK